MGTDMSESHFIRACRGRNSGRIPMWMMRQAGRYLPEYRTVRDKVSFSELCRTPELILEVVRQPLVRFDFDAAILFSDILTILEPMGVTFDFAEGGPRLDNPFDSPDDIARLQDCDVEKDLPFVYDAIRLIKREIPEKPLIGFIGSPITLACYLIEGGGSKTFNKAKRFIHEHPKAAERLFERLADTSARYLAAQAEAGCDAVQVFDSWGGILSGPDYQRWSIPYLNRIFASLKGSSIPRILFVNNLAPYAHLMRDIDCEVIGVDFRMDLASAFEQIPDKAIQGNLNPSALYGSPAEVAAETRRVLDAVAAPERFIFNLGHGIQPETPIDAVEAMVETVRSHKVPVCL